MTGTLRRFLRKAVLAVAALYVKAAKHSWRIFFNQRAVGLLFGLGGAKCLIFRKKEFSLSQPFGPFLRRYFLKEAGDILAFV
ncbi:MAG: hypothetical protein RMJ33_00965 [Saprospiraceae bacterium]|nr:hypothetical protein [Saprospiraceae bacterium]MDW8228379.1 hypothetical protein [Saprospiraceae bacterium]